MVLGKDMIRQRNLYLYVNWTFETFRKPRRPRWNRVGRKGCELLLSQRGKEARSIPRGIRYEWKSFSHRSRKPYGSTHCRVQGKSLLLESLLKKGLKGSLLKEWFRHNRKDFPWKQK